MWFDMRAFWLYSFAMLIWCFSRVMARIAVNHLEIRIHLESVQNRVRVVPGVDANTLLEQMRESLAEGEWKQLSDTINFARRG